MVRIATKKNSDCLHEKTLVEMRGPGTSKHCVTNIAADEEAAIAAIIAAIFLLNKEEENREPVLDLPNVLAVLYTKERSHIPRITGYADNVVVVRNITE